MGGVRPPPPIPKPKIGPREELLAAIGDSELYTRKLAGHIGKTERTVAYMLKAMEKDGLVTSRVHSEGRYHFVCKVRLWKATGKPLVNPITSTERRAIRIKETRVPFDFAALLIAMR